MDQQLKKTPQLGYQVQLAGPDVEAAVQTPEQIRQFLNGMYGARTSSGQTMFDPRDGIILENVPHVGKTPLLSNKVTPPNSILGDRC